MTNMKYETMKVHVVHYDDLESFVKKATGKDYSFVAEEDSVNGRYHFYQDIDRTPDFTTPDVQKWVDGKGSIAYCAHHLLQWLCVHEHIEPGNYLIWVFW